MADRARQKLDELLAGGVLEDRIKVTRGAVSDLNNDDGFELVQSDATKRVMQRLTADRYLTVKIDAVLDNVRPSDTVIIWREASLYPKWFPFVSGGHMLAEKGPAEIVIHLVVETFFLCADMVLHGYAVDDMTQSGTMLLCVRPVKADTKGMPTECNGRLPREDYAAKKGKPFGGSSFGGGPTGM